MKIIIKYLCSKDVSPSRKLTHHRPKGQHALFEDDSSTSSSEEDEILGDNKLQMQTYFP